MKTFIVWCLLALFASPIACSESPRPVATKTAREAVATGAPLIDVRSPEEFAAQIEALLNRPDASRLLADIACPTLVACGRHDDWSPLARHREMKERIAGARLAVIEDAGHMTTMEQPERTARLLADWFSG